MMDTYREFTEQERVSAEFVERDETGLRLRTADMIAEIVWLRAAMQKIQRRADATPKRSALREVIIMARQALRQPTGSRNLLAD